MAHPRATARSVDNVNDRQATNANKSEYIRTGTLEAYLKRCKVKGEPAALRALEAGLSAEQLSAILQFDLVPTPDAASDINKPSSSNGHFTVSTTDNNASDSEQQRRLTLRNDADKVSADSGLRDTLNELHALKGP